MTPPPRSLTCDVLVRANRFVGASCSVSYLTAVHGGGNITQPLQIQARTHSYLREYEKATHHNDLNICMYIYWACNALYPRAFVYTRSTPLTHRQARWFQKRSFRFFRHVSYRFRVQVPFRFVGNREPGKFHRPTIHGTP